MYYSKTKSRMRTMFGIVAHKESPESGLPTNPPLENKQHDLQGRKLMKNLWVSSGSRFCQIPQQFHSKCTTLLSKTNAVLQLSFLVQHKSVPHYQFNITSIILLFMQ
uniref:Uncharacterized protein n=1 Tax=Physcomitrium patens TaxID=3218 RepID=A0A2K1K3G1_PHYPA|nr:hypothetical protein PHYPA_012783 [Physcomitrium patens]